MEVTMFGTLARYCNGFPGYGRFAFGGIGMIILGIILVAAVIYFIWKNSSSKTESPLDLLQKRFVNGEISEEEYKSKKETLRGK
jgi:putative membrane protein